MVDEIHQWHLSTTTVKADTLGKLRQLKQPLKFVTNTPIFPSRKKKSQSWRKSDSLKPFFQRRTVENFRGWCWEVWSLQGSAFREIRSFFRTVRPYPTKREYRKIIDLKVSAGSWYVRSEVSKIPAVSGQKRQGNKKQGKLLQVFLEFYGCGFKL